MFNWLESAKAASSGAEATEAVGKVRCLTSCAGMEHSPAARRSSRAGSFSRVLPAAVPFGEKAGAATEWQQRAEPFMVANARMFAVQ